MWDTIWHLRGATHIDDTVSDEAAIGRISNFLRTQQKPVIQQGNDGISFKYSSWHDPIFKTGTSFRGFAMVAYDEGRFWIKRWPGGRALRYDLGSYHLFIFCLFGALMFFMFGFAGFFLGVEFSVAFWRGFKLAAFAITWLYGMNMLLARLRIPAAIRKAIAAA